MVVCIWDKSGASGHCCLLFDVNLNKFATVFLLQCGRICSPKQGFWWAYFFANLKNNVKNSDKKGTIKLLYSMA
jgi:hypothetical protein